MRAPHIPFAAVAIVLGLATSAIAQTTGPTSPVAPGANVPSVGLGGIVPGGGAVAPGAEMGGINVERIGPGGSLMAPGPVGSGSGSSILTTPALPQPRVR